MKRSRKRRKGKNAAEKRRSGAFFPALQAKLAIGKADDPFEKEADSVANKVVGNSSEKNSVQKMGAEEEKVQEKPINSITSIQKMSSADEEKEAPVQKVEKEEEPVQKQEEEEEPVQRQEEEEESVQKQEEEEESVQKQEEEEEAVQPKEEDEKEVQAKSDGSGSTGNTVESKLKSSKGGGQKLSDATQTEMESGFGADFSKVNIHTGTEAQSMTDELRAQAFTSGNDIYFNKGKYDPNSKEGKHLLAHELTHTIQQKGKNEKEVQRSVLTNQSEDLEAERFRGNFRLEQAHDHERMIRRGSRGLYVSKLQQGLMTIGFELPRFGADGIFGGETERAVVRFQNSFGLQIDGIVGQETMGTLDDIHANNIGETPLGEKAGCAGHVPYNEIVAGEEKVGFFSTKKCNKIRVDVKATLLTTANPCLELLMRIDNANRTKRKIKLDVNGKEVSRTFNFVMQNAQLHHVKFTVPESCRGPGILRTEVKVKGNIFRHQ